MRELLESFKKFVEGKKDQSKENLELEIGPLYSFCTKADMLDDNPHCKKLFNITVGGGSPFEVTRFHTAEESGEEYALVKIYENDSKDYVKGHDWIAVEKLDGAIKPFVAKEKPTAQPKKEKKEKKQQYRHKKEDNK